MTDTPSSLTKLIELAKGTQFEHVAKDEQALERMFLDMLAANPDPKLREIGAGIAGGSLTWRAVAASSAYDDVVADSLAKAREFDVGVVAAELARERETTEEERKRAQEKADRADSEIEFRGVLRRRR